MITEVLIRQAEPATRMKVDVTFMRMLRPPEGEGLALPEGWSVETNARPDVAGYRLLQDKVGRDYCWWMRQAASDKDLAHFLEEGPASIALLRQGQEIRGFYELNLSNPQDINLSYFGLFPEAIGHRVGRAFLDMAVRHAWALGPLCVRVNTCSADHPRALPLYKQAGFEPVRTVEETWDVPNRLGLKIPERFLV
ncbi:acetyltransferase [Acetobacter malorum DSM 14337]|uniref:Acetyltransferase n=1 Tax=Acetobacter malorum DSM 14337 TaxID=1307910 RepID=A0ABQ0PUK0_9PROT|nr:GNAT family N-acetyltransferase [Acetobacter malorum]KXV04513.1 acetyltransferase [Acetobacter malorum]GBQ81653.1 acetyltransferase [Acetobacter malorum DSM 14337]